MPHGSKLKLKVFEIGIVNDNPLTSMHKEESTQKDIVELQL